MKSRKTGDTYPFKFHVRDANGYVNLLAGGTWQVFLTIADKETGATIILNGACTLLDGANGYCQYIPNGAQMALPSGYEAEVKLVAPDGTVYHVPSSGREPFYIRESLS